MRVGDGLGFAFDDWTTPVDMGLLLLSTVFGCWVLSCGVEVNVTMRLYSVADVRDRDGIFSYAVV
jgi:hypothetical protein